MKQKMTKLLSLVLLLAMVLSLCVPAAFAELPDKPNLEDKALTSYHLSGGTSESFTFDMEELGLAPYSPVVEATSTTPWVAVSGTVVTASHNEIVHEEGSLRAVTTHDDTVTISYSEGEGESKVTDNFTVNFKITDNDAVALNSALDALAAASSGGGQDGLLKLLQHVAGYDSLGSATAIDEVLITKSGTKDALMELLCNAQATGLSGVTSGGISADGLSLKVNYGEFVGTMVFGNPEECSVQTNAEITDQTQIDIERNRLKTAADAVTAPHDKLLNLLDAMAEYKYAVDAGINDVDQLLLNKKGSLSAVQAMLEEFGVTGITYCGTDSNGLVVRMTEDDRTYVGTMGNDFSVRVEEEPASNREAGDLYVVASGKGYEVPDGYNTEYQIDLTGYNDATFELAADSWVTVSSNGLLTPREHGLLMAEDGLHAVVDHSETVTVKSGEKSFTVTVKVIDYYAQQYNVELNKLCEEINAAGDSKEKVKKALAYMAENYSNEPTVNACDEIIMGKKGSGQGTQDLLVSVLNKACGVAVKPGAVDANLLHIYLTNAPENYEGTITISAAVPRPWKLEQKDFSVNGSAIIGYLSNAAVLTFPSEVNGNVITTLGYPGEGQSEFWSGEVKEITIPASITTVYPTILKNYSALKTINVDSANTVYSSKNGALYSKDGSKLIAIPRGGAAVTLPSGINAIGADAIPDGLYSSIVLPQGVTTLENNAIPFCNILFIPDSVTTISTSAFPNVSSMDVVVVTGSAAETFCKSNGIKCYSVTKTEYSSYISRVTPDTTYLVAVQPQDRTAAVEAKATFTANILGSHPAMGWQFSADGKTWKDVVASDIYSIEDENLIVTVAQDLDGYKFRAVAGEIITDAATLTVAADLGESESLELGDKGYDMSRLAAKVGGAEMCRNGVGVSPASSVKLANGETALFTTAAYKWDSDVHKRYPVSMQVWMLTNKDGTYTMTHLEELDNLLRYSGSSIRLTGNKGIRMITSISEDLKNKLINQGVGGFTLQEYGTCVAWDSALGGAYPVLGNSKSAYAYKRGAADPVFARGGGLVSYTNVLVGFTNDQCKPDMSMRPYAVLADKNGNTYTVYGGTIHRSIGYIALQNKDAFKSGTDAYNYIWDIIHTVYGKDYKG